MTVLIIVKYATCYTSLRRYLFDCVSFQSKRQYLQTHGIIVGIRAVATAKNCCVFITVQPPIKVKAPKAVLTSSHLVAFVLP